MMDKDFPRTTVEPTGTTAPQNGTPGNQPAVPDNHLLEAKVDALAEEVASLKARPSSVAFDAPEKPQVVPVADLPTFKVGKKSYRFTLPKFHWNATHYVAAECLDQPALLASFVEANIGVAEEVPA